MAGNRETFGNGTMTQYVYGRNVVKQILLNPSRVHCVWLSGDDPEVEELCRKGGVRVKKVSRKDLTKLCGNDLDCPRVRRCAPYRYILPR